MNFKNTKSKFGSSSLSKIAILIVILTLSSIGIIRHINSSKPTQSLSDPLLENSILKEAIIADLGSVKSDFELTSDYLSKITNLNLNLALYDISNFDGLNELSELKILDLILKEDIDFSNINLPKLNFLTINMTSAPRTNLIFPNTENIYQLNLKADTFIDSKFMHSLNNYNNLKILDISNPYSKNKSNMCCYEDCSFISKYPNIEQLFISYANVKSLNGLEHLKNLETLYINTCHLDDVSALLKIDTINKITLSDVSISNDNRKQLKNHFGKKIELLNSGRDIDFIENEIYLYTEVNKIISDPKISKAVAKQIVVPSYRDFEPKDLDHVIILELDVSESDNINFTELEKLKGLDSLSIRSKKDLDLSNITLNNLTKLSLHDCSSNGLKLIPPKSPNLTDFRFIFSGLADDCIKNISHYDKLKTLDITAYQHDIIHYENLSFLTNCPDLEKLFIRNINIDSFDGIERLKNLNRIDVEYSTIDDISALLKLETIDDIDFYETSISDENIQKLKKHFGDKIYIKIKDK